MKMKYLTYRIEKKSLPNNENGFYLVKDVRVRNKKAKITAYLGTEAPKPGTIEGILKRHYLKIELKAAEKKAELSASQYLIGYFEEEKERRLIKSLEKTKYLWMALDNILTEDEMKKYEEQFEIQYVQGTTSIEGNTLSLNEARLLMQEGLAPIGKDLREMFEVINFKQVKRFRDHFVKRVSLDFIKRIHGLIMHNILLDSAGEFRRIDSIGIMGRDFQVTPAVEIEDELRRIIDDYYLRVGQGFCPFFEALVFHHKFELIHPFTDGNGRVGREILNYLLLREKYPRLLFLGKDRKKYLAALMKADDGDYSGLIWDLSHLILEQRLESAQSQITGLAKFKMKALVTLNVPDSIVDSSSIEEWRPYIKEKMERRPCH